jgi:phosphonate transport system substrate-binding protein
MDRDRRRWCTAMAALAAAPRLAGAARSARRDEPVRIGLTSVILDDQSAFLEQWRVYLERKMARPVRFLQRGTYRGITDLIRDHKLDLAWICGAPFVRLRPQPVLVAVPVYEGKPLYRSYLIANAADDRTHSLLDLRGKIFAYSDPDSNSGHLYTQHSLLAMGEAPTRFFGRSFFTWSHRNVVSAVADGLAQGGAVDSHVWETLRRQRSPQVVRTRVVEQSPQFGFPPIVAPSDLPRSELAVFQLVILGMQRDPQGLELLARLNLDGFAVGEPALFDSIARMTRAVDQA